MTVPANIDNLLLSSTGGYQIERSLRFNSADSAYLNRTPASAGNRKTWTWSGWVKRSGLGTTQRLFNAYSGDENNTTEVGFNASNQIEFSNVISGTQGNGFYAVTAAVFRDTSAWYHIVFAVDTTQSTASAALKVYVNGVQQTLGGSSYGGGANHNTFVNNTNVHRIGQTAPPNSGYFSGYLTEVHFIDGQALTPSSFGETDTITGVWKPKRYSGTYGTNGFYLKFAQNSIGVDLTSTATLTAPFGGTAENARVSDSVYLISNTTTGATFTLVQEDFGSVKQLSRYYIAAMYFTGGASTFELQYSTNGSSWTTAASLSITTSGQNFSGNINVNARYVRLQATAFGVNGQGGIDSLIIYQDPLGVDSSPNSNNWNVNNFSIVAGAGNDSMIDTPTPYADGGNGRGNYCTLNPLDKSSSTLSNGNLDVTVSAGISSLAFGNFEMRSGKWYWEVVPTAVNAAMIGIADADKAIGTRTWEQPNGWYYYNTGSKYNNSTDTSYGASYTTNDVIGVAYDADGGSVTFYKNGTSQGSAFTGLTGKGIVPALNNGASAVSEPYVCNFGQRSFSYTPPSGFLALNTQNLPEPSIKKPSSYMDVKLYTGNGTSQTISGLGFSPDLVWIKKRSAAENHEVQDTVRGATKRLASNTTDVESTVAGSISAFTSDGFSVGNAGTTNENTSTYAAWCWDESATPGFDIVTYTGTGVARTIAHSLGVAPSMIIVKERGNANDWPVYHASTGNLKALYLNLTNGQGGDFAGAWNSTSPTSSVFSLGTSVETNRNTGTYVAYLWSEVAGFSKFGSYTGNGSSDGPFVFCGFRPRWVMTKRTDTTSNWMIMDAGRNPSNVADNQLYPNRSDAEAGASSSMDLTSNGFKLRNTGSDFNAATATYIFAAFAESPQKYSLAR